MGKNKEQSFRIRQVIGTTFGGERRVIKVDKTVQDLEEYRKMIKHVENIEYAYLTYDTLPGVNKLKLTIAYGTQP